MSWGFLFFFLNWKKKNSVSIFGQAILLSTIRYFKNPTKPTMPRCPKETWDDKFVLG